MTFSNLLLPRLLKILRQYASLAHCKTSHRFVPMAILRDEALAYKPEGTEKNAMEQSMQPALSAPTFSLVSAFIDVPVPTVKLVEKEASHAFEIANRAKEHLLSSGQCAVNNRRNAVSAMGQSSFILTGNIQDVCAQLEQWAAQESQWLRAS